MYAVYGEYDPQSASGSRASRSVAPISRLRLSVITPNPAKGNETKPVGNATGATVKRKAVNESIDDNTVPGSHSVRDQAEEHSKRVKLDNETEASVLAEITKNDDSYRLGGIHASERKYARAAIRCTTAAFSELKSAEGISEDQRYPSLGYNSVNQTATVVTCPSNVHEGATGWIEYKIFKYIDDYLSTRSPHTLSHIRECRSTTQSIGGEYIGSRKEPDGGFIYKARSSTNKLMIAIDVGTSETYDKLLDDKDMWINGNGVNVVILVWLEELPPFRNPNTRYTNIAGLAAEKDAMAQSIGETVETNITLGYYGPLEYRDHTWIGELNKAFIEVWRQDSHKTF
ncbi:hypothetical protein V1506DRAFT_563631, partial [Lipomyces tetrasporus]